MLMNGSSEWFEFLDGVNFPGTFSEQYSFFSVKRRCYTVLEGLGGWEMISSLFKVYGTAELYCAAVETYTQNQSTNSESTDMNVETILDK